MEEIDIITEKVQTTLEELHAVLPEIPADMTDEEAAALAPEELAQREFTARVHVLVNTVTELLITLETALSDSEDTSEDDTAE